MKPSETKFVLICDSREQKKLSFRRETVVAGLPTGDYSIQGYEDKICFERKGVGDLIGTCDFKNRDRFKRELERMQTFQFYCIVIAGTKDDVRVECEKLYKNQYRAWMAKKRRGFKGRAPMRPETRYLSVMGSLRAFRVDFNCHFYFLRSEEKVAQWIEKQCEYFMRHKGEDSKGE